MNNIAYFQNYQKRNEFLGYNKYRKKINERNLRKRVLVGVESMILAINHLSKPTMNSPLWMLEDRIERFKKDFPNDDKISPEIMLQNIWCDETLNRYLLNVEISAILEHTRTIFDSIDEESLNPFSTNMYKRARAIRGKLEKKYESFLKRKRLEYIDKDLLGLRKTLSQFQEELEFFQEDLEEDKGFKVKKNTEYSSVEK